MSTRQFFFVRFLFRVMSNHPNPNVFFPNLFCLSLTRRGSVVTGKLWTVHVNMNATLIPSNKQVLTQNTN